MIVVDTTVLIDLRKGRPGVKKILSKYIDKETYISEISIKELFEGLGYTSIKMGEPLYSVNLQKIRKIISMFYLIPISQSILEEAGLKQGEFQAKGIIIDTENIIIGSSANIHNAEFIITRNLKHFDHFDVPCISYDI